MMVLIAALAIGGWVTYTVFGPGDGTQPEALRTASRSDDALQPRVAVQLHAGDPTVQWVRLENKNGTRLINARPDGDALVPRGTHRISVKVTARTKLVGDIFIDKAISLTCKPATMGRVRCTDSNGKETLLLQPPN